MVPCGKRVGEERRTKIPRGMEKKNETINPAKVQRWFQHFVGGKQIAGAGGLSQSHTRGCFLSFIIRRSVVYIRCQRGCLVGTGTREYPTPAAQHSCLQLGSVADLRNQRVVEFPAGSRHMPILQPCDPRIHVSTAL